MTTHSQGAKIISKRQDAILCVLPFQPLLCKVIPIVIANSIRML